MTDTQDSLARAARLSFWSGPVSPQPLAGGLTNTNCLVEDGGRKYVVRIGGDMIEHGIIRSTELAASHAAAEAGISPIVVHAEPGAMVIDFVEGRSLTPADIRDERYLGRIVELLRRAHHDIPRFFRGPAPLFWVFQVIRDYTHTLEAGERLEKAVGPVELVFGHNDMLAANLIDDGQRLWLVDWDYAGFNSPLFDLGGLASNNLLSRQQAERALELYFDRPLTDELRRRAAAMTAASLLRETMWSMVSELHSHLVFDYPAYTAEYLGRFKLALASFDEMERA